MKLITQAGGVLTTTQGNTGDVVITSRMITWAERGE